MEATGRIIRLLKKQEGTSTRTGNKWTALPFVLEYFEKETDRYCDRVVLSTYDTNIMKQLSEFMVKGADGKAVLENNEYKLTQQVEVTCVFGHNIYEGEKQPYNDLRLFKMEVLSKAAPNVAAAPAPVQVQAPTPQPPQQQSAQTLINSFAELEKADELPF
ncbi:MAG: hypothetical protein IKT83_01055 [Bacteroidaceae bacterium]|nr:hypothetical protein [Bacteroidaceae bacterium]